jgi:hypothetical protein
MSVQNKPIAAVLDHTLGTGGHGVATTVVGAGGDPTGADGGYIVLPRVTEIETVVHATGSRVPRRAVGPRELGAAIRLNQALLWGVGEGHWLAH